jgi:hypothetical protein
MLDFSVVYDGASKREKEVLDKIDGNTLNKSNMIAQLSSFKFSHKDLEILRNIVELYKSLNQNEGFIEVLDSALEKIKRQSAIIEKVLKEARI